MELTAHFQVGCVYREHARVQSHYAKEGMESSYQSLSMDYVDALCYGALGCMGWSFVETAGFERSCLKLLFVISFYVYSDEKSKWGLVLHTKKDSRCPLCPVPPSGLQNRQ